MILTRLQLTSLLLLFLCMGITLGVGYKIWEAPNYSMFFETIQDSTGHRHIDTTYYVPHKPASPEGTMWP